MSKKLFCLTAFVLLLGLALTSAVEAADIAFYVGQWNVDGWYSAEQFDHVDTIIAQTGSLFKNIQQFDDAQLDAFGAWVDENTDDGEMDIIWLNGCMPSVLYQFPNVDPDGSRAEEWLDGGNMIINVGDWFAYCSWEGGTRQADNTGTGAANILDLDAGIIAGEAHGTMVVTATGQEYLPSLNAVAAERPVVLSAIVAPWEVAAIFGQNADGTHADPVVIHNTETDGYFVSINQATTWIDDRGLTCAEFIGNWVRNVIGLGDPALAASPNPEDEAVDVLRDVFLSWEPGEFAAPTNGHKVYFGESFDDVNDATGGAAQSAAGYAPAQRLYFGTTYYWRVDEVNAPPSSTIFKGDVWSFTTEPIAYSIAGERITATTSSSGINQGPENTVNGSGFDVNYLHSTELTDMWLSDFAGPQPTWIQYEFDRVCKLHQMCVCNHNTLSELAIGYGCKDVTVEYSVDGNDYTTLGTTHEFAQAPGAPGYAYNTTVDLEGVAAKYVRLTVSSNWGGLVPLYGLSEVRFFSIPIYAREPSPEFGATDIAVDLSLRFRAGRAAVTHDVYLSSAEQAVIDGNAPVATVTEASYGPLSLDLGTTYYWRVDEVNEAETPTTWQGDICNFTTQEYFVVDDFELYNDLNPDDPDSNRIFLTWIDGYDNPATNGSVVGYTMAPFAEQSIVHGKQSMPLNYDNSTASYSEATANVADLQVGQDWTRHGIKALTLRFHGDPNNALQQMYVKVNGSKVVYDGDAENISRTAWQMWYIDLSSLGVSLSNVTKLSIGFDRIGTVAGQGVVYFDGIRLYSHDRQLITPVQPDPACLVGHWKFDGNYNDSSGNGRNGTPVGAVRFEADPVRGQVLSLPGGDDQFVDIGSVGIDGNMPRTIACWAKADNTDIPDWTLIFGFTGDVTGEGGNGSHFNIGSLGGPGGVGAHCWGWEETIFSDEAALDWHHYAMTYDGTTIQYYGDGILMDTDTGKSNVRDISASADRVHVGSRITQTSSFPGKVDDAQIFNRVLSDAEVAWLGGVTKPFDKPF